MVRSIEAPLFQEALKNYNSLTNFANYADFSSKFLKWKEKRNQNLAQIVALFEHFFCDGVTEIFFWRIERYFAITENCECEKLDRKYKKAKTSCS